MYRSFLRFTPFVLMAAASDVLGAAAAPAAPAAPALPVPFASVKNQPQKKMFTTMLKSAVDALANAPHTLSVPKDKYEKFANATKDMPLVNLIGDDAAVTGNVIIQANTNGVDALKRLPADEGSTASAASSEPKAAVKYETGEMDDLPGIARGGNKGESYPFESLGAPKQKFEADGTTPILVDGKPTYKFAFFFVPATEQKPNPQKSLSSTASSASERYTKQGTPRKFEVRKKVENGKITGAYCIRTT